MPRATAAAAVSGRARGVVWSRLCIQGRVVGRELAREGSVGRQEQILRWAVGVRALYCHHLFRECRGRGEGSSARAGLCPLPHPPHAIPVSFLGPLPFAPVCLGPSCWQIEWRNGSFFQGYFNKCHPTVGVLWEATDKAGAAGSDCYKVQCALPKPGEASEFLESLRRSKLEFASKVFVPPNQAPDRDESPSQSLSRMSTRMRPAQ